MCDVKGIWDACKAVCGGCQKPLKEALPRPIHSGICKRPAGLPAVLDVLLGCGGSAPDMFGVSWGGQRVVGGKSDVSRVIL